MVKTNTMNGQGGARVVYLGITRARLAAMVRWWPQGAPVREIVGLRLRHGAAPAAWGFVPADSWRQVMSGEIHLVTRQTCPACNGARLVDHPAWDEFMKEFVEQKRPLVDLQNGYARAWFEVRGYAETPPLEEPCGTCIGTGMVEGTIPLSDVLNFQVTLKTGAGAL